MNETNETNNVEDCKVCPNCEQELSKKAFHRKSDMADGLYPICKLCRSKTKGHKPNGKTRRSIEQTSEKVVPKFSIEEIVAEVNALYARYPHNLVYQRAFIELRDKPEGPHSASTGAVLFRMWEAKITPSGAFDKLDETAPIITPRRQQTIRDKEQPLCKSHESEFFGTNPDLLGD